MLCFDPQTRAWQRKADLEAARRNHALVAIGGKLYALGGYRANSDVERYDPATDAWETMAPNSSSRTPATTRMISCEPRPAGGSPRGTANRRS